MYAEYVTQGVSIFIQILLINDLDSCKFLKEILLRT